ncbi:hypothetical protein M404DRAFT_31588 [Pisolithus tinctorius Marx 270]|uniref:Uncharacterized protein n=1 Tax=Pisolithus tinctorius Marx 270 TaxID=870435 RepID=A0A0C3NAW2_PISTI|nr:hypothetical protein M404DRAFT_31588 [Pisolithus tinctorius Marx 270]
MTLLSTDKRPYEVGGAVRWERCATSTGTELDGSKGKRLSTTNSDDHDTKKVNDGLRTSDGDSEKRNDND